MPIWYYADAMRQRQGPYTADELVQRLHRSELNLETLVWRDGLPQWQPLRERMAELPFVAGWHPSATTQHAGAGYGTNDHSPYAAPIAAITSDETFVTGGEVIDAGFWKRVAALLIDSMIVGFSYYAVLIVAVVVLGVGAAVFEDKQSGFGQIATFGLGALIYLLYPLVSALYYAGFESSTRQATLGKMAVGIKVTGLDGRRLSLGNALGRWAAALLNYLTILIGYLMAAFTTRKQGLHDLAAGTRVVDRWAYTSHPDWQVPGLGTVAKVVLILFGILYGLALLGILAAILIPLATQN